ncbi:2-oxoglutarate-malate translocator [Furfurilactobacillus rossiae]|nr:2-oxoglutarate-malate translocator [Furfurilactobacillus rossiae]
MAPNLVAVAMAGKAGVHITWISWFIAALVPGIISLICVPYIIYKLYPPEVKETPNAKDWADKELADMGPMSTPEKIMMSVFLIALLLWIASSFIGLDATLVAFIAVSLLLLTGVLSVQDILKETGAWNTLIWFSILIFMANELTQLGLIKWLSSSIGTALHGVSWMMVLVILFIFYFYTHYLFASGTAHVTAMYAALLAVALAAGVPHMLAAIMLAFAGPLFSSTTHYASGPATVLFGSGFVKQSDWWRLNAILGVFYIVVWLGGGLLWTKVLGMW